MCAHTYTDKILQRGGSQCLFNNFAFTMRLQFLWKTFSCHSSCILFFFFPKKKQKKNQKKTEKKERGKQYSQPHGTEPTKLTLHRLSNEGGDIIYYKYHLLLFLPNLIGNIHSHQNIESKERIIEK